MLRSLDLLSGDPSANSYDFRTYIVHQRRPSRKSHGVLMIYCWLEGEHLLRHEEYDKTCVWLTPGRPYESLSILILYSRWG